MKLGFKNKTLLITGASSGLGREFARSIATDVKKLILVARRKTELDILAMECKQNNSELNVVIITCDLSDIKAVQELTQKVKNLHGKIDILVNAAGIGQTAFFEDAPLDEINSLVQVNVIALTQMCHAFLPDMVKQGSGGILNFSSFFGRQILPGFAANAASKHYVTGLTKVLRAETSGTGVVVSCVYPGPVKSDFWNTKNANLLSPPEFLFISITQCVRETLSGFRRGRAVIIPSLRIKLLMIFLDLSPKFIVRMVNAKVARLRREKKEKINQSSLIQVSNTNNKMI